MTDKFIISCAVLALIGIIYITFKELQIYISKLRALEGKEDVDIDKSRYDIIDELKKSKKKVNKIINNLGKNVKDND